MYLKQYQKVRHGFTLIELLVVIVIILILAAILFPVFIHVREKARQVKCVSNIRQIGIAINAYLEDNQGGCPPCGNIWSWDYPSNFPYNEYPCLFDLLEPYTKNKELFSCETLPFKRCYLYQGTGGSSGTQRINTWTVNSNRWYGTTYTACLWLRRIGARSPSTGTGPNGVFYLKFAMLPFHEGGTDNIANLYAYKWNNLNGAGQTADSTNSIILACMSGGWVLNGEHIMGHHLEDGLALFADGHVKLIPWQTHGDY